MSKKYSLIWLCFMLLFGLSLSFSVNSPLTDTLFSTFLSHKDQELAQEMLKASSPLPVTSPSSALSSGVIQSARVVRVVDGDTVELDSGHKVRYIGIDTPESVDPRRPQECYGKEATQANKRLVEGKQVWLEKDVSETDRYGRLLRYVYVVPEQESVAEAVSSSSALPHQALMVNRLLVSQGFATVSTFPPDVKHNAELESLETTARLQGVGLWSSSVCQ